MAQPRMLAKLKYRDEEELTCSDEEEATYSVEEEHGDTILHTGGMETRSSSRVATSLPPYRRPPVLRTEYSSWDPPIMCSLCPAQFSGIYKNSDLAEHIKAKHPVDIRGGHYSSSTTARFNSKYESDLAEHIKAKHPLSFRSDPYSTSTTAQIRGEYGSGLAEHPKAKPPIGPRGDYYSSSMRTQMNSGNPINTPTAYYSSSGTLICSLCPEWRK